MNKLPAGWQIKTVKDVCTLQNGNGFKPSEWSDAGLPIIRIQNLNGSKAFNYFAGKPKPNWLISPGEILFAWAGTKGVSFGPFIWTGPQGVLNQHIFRTTPSVAVDRDWLYYSLKHLTFEIEGKAHGFKATLLHVPKGDIERQRLLVPPHYEQIQIAQILSTWDKAIATSERLFANSQQQKKALMQQLLTGQKRFSEFHEEWRVANFSSLYLVKNDKKTQTTSRNYLEHGKNPIVDQGQALIAGYTDSNQVYRDVPVIVFGDHTRAIKWVDFEFSPGADGTQILKASDLLEARFAYYLLSNADIPNLGYSRHMRELKEIDFRYPTDKAEQQKIAQVLSTADAEIANLQAQLDKLKLEKKALMQQLLTGKRRVRLDDEEEDVAPIRRVG